MLLLVNVPTPAPASDDRALEACLHFRSICTQEVEHLKDLEAKRELFNLTLEEQRDGAFKAAESSQSGTWIVPSVLAFLAGSLVGAAAVLTFRR